MAPPDWDDLRHFLAVARAGSLAGAARALGVNHATVYRRLNAFERRLGTTLFDRRPEGYLLTAAGEDMRAVAERVDAEVIGLDRRLSGRDVRLAGNVRATTSDTLAHRFLAPHVAAFHAAHPGIVVELVVDNQFLNLSKREADVAIRPTRRPSELLIGRKVAGVAFALYGARSRRRSARRADPAHEPWLGLDDSLAHVPTARWMAARVPADKIVFRSNSYMTLATAAAAGLGIAHLPCFVGDVDPGLERLASPDPEIASELWLLTHEDLRTAARVRAFTDFMAASIRRDRDLLEGKGRRR